MKPLLDYRIINGQIRGFSFQQIEVRKPQIAMTQKQLAIEISKKI